MGKKSVKENKNIYQLSREAQGLTREKAADLMEFISADRIEKIESEKSLPRPEEVMAMEKCYKKAELCNYFCTHECPIGQTYVSEVTYKELSQITLEMLASLNALEKEKNRLIEITVDGTITEDEAKDFLRIKGELQDISDTIESFKLWVEHTILTGRIEKDWIS